MGADREVVSVGVLLSWPVLSPGSVEARSSFVLRLIPHHTTHVTEAATMRLLHHSFTLLSAVVLFTQPSGTRGELRPFAKYSLAWREVEGALAVLLALPPLADVPAHSQPALRIVVRTSHPALADSQRHSLAAIAVEVGAHPLHLVVLPLAVVDHAAVLVVHGASAVALAVLPGHVDNHSSAAR